jgi:hypothetical protein
MRRAAFVVLLMATTSCSRMLYESHFAAPAQVEKISEAATRSPFLKVHMPDGRVFVLERWSIEEGSGIVAGHALEYGANRVAVGPPRDVTIPLEGVALLETNRPYTVDVGTGSVIGMVIGTTASLALSLVCFAAGRTCYR